MANRRKPTVISTSPKNYAVKVPVHTSIKVTFDIDLDNRYIDEFVYMLDNLGNRIEGRVVYRKKIITFTPKQSLSMGSTYKLCLIGDSDLTDKKEAGIRSIIGDSLRGNVTIQFTTEADELTFPPEIISPMHQSIIKELPVFSWEAIEKAKGYQLQLSTTNTFTSLIYPTDDDPNILHNTSFEPMLELKDGVYYFRIRSLRDDGVPSEWSKTFQFHYTTLEEGTISEDDEDPFDATDDELFGNSTELEVVEEFPESGQINVPLNVKSLYFRVIGTLDLSSIDADSFNLIGKHVSDDYEEESHGKVEGRITVVQSNDGTTYIVFTPEPISTEDEDIDEEDGE